MPGPLDYELKILERIAASCTPNPAAVARVEFKSAALYRSNSLSEPAAFNGGQPVSPRGGDLAAQHHLDRHSAAPVEMSSGQHVSSRGGHSAAAQGHSDRHSLPIELSSVEALGGPLDSILEVAGGITALAQRPGSSRPLLHTPGSSRAPATADKALPSLASFSPGSATGSKPPKIKRKVTWTEEFDDHRGPRVSLRQLATMTAFILLATAGVQHGVRNSPGMRNTPGVRSSQPSFEVAHKLFCSESYYILFVNSTPAVSQGPRVS